MGAVHENTSDFAHSLPASQRRLIIRLAGLLQNISFATQHKSNLHFMHFCNDRLSTLCQCFVRAFVFRTIHMCLYIYMYFCFHLYNISVCSASVYTWVFACIHPSTLLAHHWKQRLLSTHLSNCSTSTGITHKL